MAEQQLIGALEAGGTKMVCATGYADGTVLEREQIATTTPQETVEAVNAWFADKGIAALGIGAFGPTAVNPASPQYGKILETPKTAWRYFDLLGTIQNELNIPCGYDTDVNVACLGEVTFGCAKGLTDVVYLTIGTGVGAGVLSGERKIEECRENIVKKQKYLEKLKTAIAESEKGKEEAEAAVSVHGVVGHARIDQRQRNAPSLCGVQQVRPDFRLENDETGGLNQVEGAADEREKVDGAEDDFHAVGHFLLRDFLRGRRGGRENETAVRVDFAPRLKGGECEIGFADAYRMHPDRAVERFQARLFLFGENGEAFRIRAFDSRTADQFDEQSRQEKQERQRKEQVV